MERRDDKHVLVGALLHPDYPMTAAVAGVAEFWIPETRMYVYRETHLWFCSSFHHDQYWVWPLSFRQNFLWILNNPRVVLHCYWVWFSKTMLLWVCITVRQPSPQLPRERMEPSWRLWKHTQKPLHISSLIYDLMGSVTLEIFDVGVTSPQSHWFTGGQCLKLLLLKSHHQTKDLKATVETDYMFSQSDLWDKGSNLWLSLLYAGEDLPSWFFPMPSVVPGTQVALSD